jgi:hypothetical protein
MSLRAGQIRAVNPFPCSSMPEYPFLFPDERVKDGLDIRLRESRHASAEFSLSLQGMTKNFLIQRSVLFHAFGLTRFI